MRLVDESGSAAATNDPDPAILRLLARAHSWWAELQEGETNVTAIARRENVSPSWITWVTRLAFLSPKAVEAILAGQLRSGFDAKALLAAGAIPAGWAEQEKRLLAKPG